MNVDYHSLIDLDVLFLILFILNNNCSLWIIEPHLKWTLIIKCRGSWTSLDLLIYYLIDYAHFLYQSSQQCDIVGWYVTGFCVTVSGYPEILHYWRSWRIWYLRYCIFPLQTDHCEWHTHLVSQVSQVSSQFGLCMHNLLSLDTGKWHSLHLTCTYVPLPPRLWVFPNDSVVHVWLSLRVVCAYDLFGF